MTDYMFLKRLAYELAWDQGKIGDAARLRNLASVHKEVLEATTTLTHQPLAIRVCPDRQEK